MSAILLSALLLWDPNPPEDGIFSYRVYEKCSPTSELTLSNQFTDYTDVGFNPRLETALEPNRIHYFCVTAIDWIGQESAPSKGIFIIYVEPL